MISEIIDCSDETARSLEKIEKLNLIIEEEKKDKIFKKNKIIKKPKRIFNKRKKYFRKKN